MRALKEAEQRFNSLGLDAAAVDAAEYDKAYDRAKSTKPTTPAGAAALLSIIDTDEPFVPGIIAALEGVPNG